MFNEYNEIITINELCEILDIGRTTAYFLLREKKIKAFKIGRDWRIPLKSVKEYIFNESSLRPQFIKNPPD